MKNNLETQDLVGRDLAKEFELMFEIMFKGDPEKMAIIKNTKMYTYLTGVAITHFPQFKHPWKRRVPRTESRSKILSKVALERYHNYGVIPDNERDNLQAMIDSPDKENLVIVESLLIAKYRKPFNKVLKSIRNELLTKNL